MGSSVFHLAEVIWVLPCQLLSLSFRSSLWDGGGSRFNVVGREEQSESFVLFSDFFFPQIFQSGFVCKILMEWSWKNYACCSWHFLILLHAAWRTCCLSQKLWNWMEIDLGCFPVSFLKPYILQALPFFLWFPSLPSRHAPLQWSL